MGTNDDGSAEKEEPANLWTRWDDDEEGEVGEDGLLPLEDLHLHRYCDVWPFDSHDRGSESKEGNGEEEAEDEEVTIRYLEGPIRTGLRYTPNVVLVVAVVFVVSAELWPGRSELGISALVSSVPSLLVPGVVGALLLWFVLFWLVVDAGLLDLDDLRKALVVYGLLG
ncbi:MAG: hypothetical protein R3324_10730, partial [Halobacteriales archaeon]|nr:hypothetical protein [Halobacteriales archaeon]